MEEKPSKLYDENSVFNRLFKDEKSSRRVGPVQTFERLFSGDTAPAEGLRAVDFLPSYDA